MSLFELINKRVQKPDNRVRDLYVDALVRIITNTIYEDPSSAPWHEGRGFGPHERDQGMDWPQKAHTMVGVKRLRNLATLTQKVIDDDIPGDFIETGVWRGGCCILMRGILAANNRHDRKVYVADSFEGLPVPTEGVEADKGDEHHTFMQLQVTQEEVAANFERYGLLDETVVFLKGWFKDTLPALEPRARFALLRLDGDMYESTMDGLSALYPKLSRGGYVIIDDYGCVPGCKQAVHDYRQNHGINDEIVTIDWTGVYWRKS